MAERLESRVLYSADALGPLAPLLVETDDERDQRDREISALLGFSPAPDEVRSLAFGAGHIVFVDGGVADHEALAYALDLQGATIVIIGEDDDGIDVISRTLAEHSDLSAIHLFSHGNDGTLTLGTATLDAAALEARGSAIEQWGSALSTEGDLLLYGCDVGHGTLGLELVGALSQLTDADVAASSNATGHASRGGDWILETRRGSIDVDTIDERTLGGAWEHVLASFTVTETADGNNAPASIDTLDELQDWVDLDPLNNRATLRDAISVANRSVGEDLIVLGAGTYQLTVDGTQEDDNRDGDLDVRDSLTIRGSGSALTTIEGNRTDRIFEVIKDSELNLEGLTVTGGFKDGLNGEDGGGISAEKDSRLTINDVWVIGNEAGEGGGIVIKKDASLLVENSVVSGNTALTTGGGIHARAGAVVSIDGSTFGGNRAEDSGGALSGARTASFTVSNSIFDGNSANADGGAINVNELTLETSILRGNSVDLGQGGAVWADGALTADTVLFENNSAPGNGGALLLNGGSVLENVSFVGNSSASAGGAVSLQTGDLSLASNVTFSGNSASQAGAIHAQGPLQLWHGTFYGNTATLENSAIWIDGNHYVSVANSAFEANSSTSGEASIDSSTISLGFNVFDDDVALALAVSDREDTAALLEPLALSGSIVPTHAPADASPLIDSAGASGRAQDAAGQALDEIPDVGAHEYSAERDVIYYVDDNSRILRVGESLSNPQVIINDAFDLTDIAVDLAGGRVYWLEDNGNFIGSADLDGGNRALLFSPPSGGVATALEIDPVYRLLLVAADGGRSIIRYDLDNVAAPPQPLVTDPVHVGEVVELTVAGSGTPGDPVRVYWVDSGSVDVDRAIRSASIEEPVGSMPAAVNIDIQTHFGPDELLGSGFEALDANATGTELYLTDSAQTALVRADLLSSTLYSIPQDGEIPRAIGYSVDADRLYFSSDLPHTISVTDSELTVSSLTQTVGSEVQSLSVARTLDNATPWTADPQVISGSFVLSVDESGFAPLTTETLEIEDADTEAADLIYTFADPNNGEIQVNGVRTQTFTDAQLRAGDVSYVHDAGGLSGENTIVLHVSDGTGGRVARVISIEFQAVNDPPVLSVSDATVFSGVPLTLTDAVLSATDTDSDDASLEYTVALPDHLTLSVAGMDANRFTHEQLLNGDVALAHPEFWPDQHVDTITVSVDDGEGGLASAQWLVTHEPNNPGAPSAQPDAVQVNEGSSQATLQSGSSSVLANDTDPQGPRDVLSATIVDQPLHGTVTLAEDGSFVYQHDGGESRTDSFTYVARDLALQTSSPARVDVAIAPTNDAPRLVGAIAAQTAMEGEAFSLSLAADLWEDDDAGDQLAVSITLADGSTLPDWLVAAIQPAAAGDAIAPVVLSGTPGDGDVGTLELRVVARDGEGAESDALSLVVNVLSVDSPPGLVSLDGATVVENVAGATVGVLNVSDEDGADSVTLSVDGDSRFVIDGRTLRLADGVSLDHENREREYVRVLATDGLGVSTISLLQITVLDRPDGPTAQDDYLQLDENGVASRLSSGAESLLDNDAPGAAGIVSVEVATAPRFGSLSLEDDGRFSYAHDGSESSSDSFTYTVRDASGQVSEDARVEISVAGVNDPPVSVSLQTSGVEENVSQVIVGQLSAIDEDVDDTVEFAVTDPRFVVDGSARLLLAPGVTLDHEQEPVVEIVVTAFDAAGESVSQGVRIEVIDRNDAPVLVNAAETVTVAATEPYRLPPETFVDADGDTLTLSASQASGAELPDWLVFDVAQQAFLFVDDGVENDSSAIETTVDVRVTADDGRGGQSFLDFAIQRAPVPAAATPESPTPESPNPEPPSPESPEPEPLAPEPSNPEPPSVEPSAPEPAPAQPFTTAEAPVVSLAVPSPAAELPGTPEAQATVSAASAPAPVPAADIAQIAERVDVQIERVDLAELIGDGPDIGRLALADVSYAVAEGQSLDERGLLGPAIQTIDLAELLGTSDNASRAAFAGLADALERQEDRLQERASFAQTLVGSSVGLTSGLSVGYLIWLIRGGTLVGSMLSSLPAWRFVDPLPVLSGLVNPADDDEESLESMVTADRSQAEQPTIEKRSPTPSSGAAGADPNLLG